MSKEISIRWDDDTKCYQVDVKATALGRLYRDELKAQGRHETDEYWVGANPEQVGEWLLYGDPSRVKEFMKFSKEVKRRIRVNTGGKEQRNVLCGGSVRVPSYLQGKPNCFVRQVTVQSEKSPVNVYINQGVSCGTGRETIEKRGLAMTAFAQVLSTARPVNLYVYNYVNIKNKDVCVRMRLGVTPINWGLAGFLAGHPAGLRNTGFILARLPTDSTDGHIGWGSRARFGEVAPPEILGHNPDKDVVFGGGYVGDPLLDSDPVGWVKQQLSEVDSDLIL